MKKTFVYNKETQKMEEKRLHDLFQYMDPSRPRPRPDTQDFLKALINALHKSGNKHNFN